MELIGIALKFIILANTAVRFVSSGLSNCEPRPGPDNGQAVFTASKNWRRAVEVYQCEDGYVLTGQTKCTCVEGEWSGRVPSCTRHSADLNNFVGPAQGWFSFRRVLRFEEKRKLKRYDRERIENKSIGIDDTPLRTSDRTFQFPKHMIRDSAREYSTGDYDLSCMFRKRHGKHFLRAPNTSYAYVLKYSKKTNPVRPNNKYLEAIYHCVKGHIFENPVQNRLRCSNGHWVGVKPTCVPKTTPMTIYQMERYIKCPPEKNVSLAEGENFINFQVERPITNYDWNKFGSLSSGWSKNSTRILVPGVYVITYTVRDEEGTAIASCRTTVRVTDDEIPTVHDCPSHLEVVDDFSKNDTRVTVTWSEPRFTDNVGVIQTVKTIEPGQSLGPGVYNVLYVASDASRNEATCNFKIEVKDLAQQQKTEKQYY